MSVRARAVETLARTLEGGLSFNNVKHIVRIGPLHSRREISRKEYDRRYDQTYVKVVDSIDWNRVFLEANSRHIALKHSDPEDGPCGECVREALLAPVWQDWNDERNATRGTTG